MVLNRRYDKTSTGALKDGTTYIDPAKFNNIFAETAFTNDGIKDVKNKPGKKYQSSYF